MLLKVFLSREGVYILCERAVIFAQHNNAGFAFDLVNISQWEFACLGNTKLLSVLIKHKC